MGDALSGCMSGLKRAAEETLHPLSKKPKVEPKVAVFVMMQLDWMSEDGTALRHEAKLREQLKGLVKAGVKGVMADIWWGVCEPAPGKYEFGAAKALCEMLASLDLKLQAVMSFHKCGGNVGDVVNIPIPEFALSVAKAQDRFYRSSTGVVAEDCLSLSADAERIFAGPDGRMRTALQCYRDYMKAFVDSMGSHIGTTVCELQVGMGPCGELRYPSYMISNGWSYPGVGLLMASDSGMLRMLRSATGLTGPPPGAPTDQNAMCDSSPLFNGDAQQFADGPGRKFLEWYASALLAHGEAILREAAVALSGCTADSEALVLSVKISGLHWHCMHPSRATEACAGYNCCSSPKADFYSDAAAMFAKMSASIGRKVLFNFTCMEMNNHNGGMPEALSAPEDLIGQVRRACVRHGVPMAGENALEFDLATGEWAFNQMGKQMRAWSPGSDRMHGLTLLRLGDGFVRHSSLLQLQKFVMAN
mmetsp:Transcript_57540/g.136875  ORF Transcript_57540/g.136875 Transcript_57540/m.136875 type:complete len:475 (+) Transcript_57540:60-1484(+)